jgi:hypothetical protein
MGQTLSDRDAARLGRILPQLERMVNGPTTHRARTPQVIPASRQVKVTNMEPGDDWPAWSPVAVLVPEGSPIDNPAGFWAAPTFPGYRLDNAAFAGRVHVMLGITQEPIAHGKTGRVAIEGLTPALVQKCPSDYTDNGSWEWVHVRKNGSRWTLRNGPAGDARFVQMLDFDLFQDGTYNDQYLCLIDLCDAPNRVCFWNQTGETVPLRSVIRWTKAGHSHKPDSNATDGQYTLFDLRSNGVLCGTCGWAVPPNQWGWAYKFDPTMPVCVTLEAAAINLPMNSRFGPAGGSFKVWEFLPGFESHTPDWYKYGVPPYCLWVTKNLRPFYARRTTSGSSYAYALQGTSGSSNAYDGTGGRPIVRAWLKTPPGYRSLNIADGAAFECELNSEYGFTPHPMYLDDPIGTIKGWAGTSIPQGWQQNGAGYIKRYQ